MNLGLMVNRAVVLRLLMLALPTAAVTAAALVLLHWRMPTQIQIDLTVNRIILIPAGNDSVPILNDMAFQSITVGRFATLRLTPKRWVPDEFGVAHRGSAQKGAAIASPVIFTAGDPTLQPTVTLERASSEPATLNRIWARPGSQVTL
jgi:hypothetical protein